MQQGRCLALENHTFLTLARAPVIPGGQHPEAARVGGACLARRLALRLLEEIAQRVAADATELPHFGLEVTYDHGASEGRRTGQPRRIQIKLIPCSSQTNRFLEGALLPAEQDVHVLTTPPTDAEPAGHGAQLDSSTA